MSSSFCAAVAARAADAAPEGRLCATCGVVFASRNRLFAHLREQPTHGSAAHPRHTPVPVPPSTRANASHDAYYVMQRVAPAEAWAAATAAFRRPLPRHVRWIESSPLLAAVKPLFAGGCTPSLIPSAAVIQEGLADVARIGQNLGALQLQEACSCLPALALCVQPHHYVIDLCAAPGSKTLQILDAMQGKQARGTGTVATALPEAAVPDGLLVANDRSGSRLKVAAGRSRRQPRTALLWTNHDAAHFPTTYRRGGHVVAFDRVLVDVPCSGDGMLRKDPKLWRSWSVAEGLQLHRRQLAILLRGLTLLKHEPMRPTRKLLGARALQARRFRRHHHHHQPPPLPPLPPL